MNHADYYLLRHKFYDIDRTRSEDENIDNTIFQNVLITCEQAIHVFQRLKTTFPFDPES